MNFRSQMEANVYRYLTECDPELKLVELEPHLFTERDGLPNGFRYLPDFRCTKHDGSQFYIEVKGVLDERSRHKLSIMRRYRPDIKILLITPDIYQKIRQQFAKKIKGWE